MRLLLPGFWFSCARYTERLSRVETVPLTRAERAAYTFHYYWCVDCRRYKTQIVQLETTLEEFCRAFAEGEIELPNEPGLVLPEDFRNRLAAQIEASDKD